MERGSLGCTLEEESMGPADWLREAVRTKGDLGTPHRRGKTGGGEGLNSTSHETF